VASPDGRTLHLVLQGGADSVVKVAAQYPLVSLTSHEPSLEDIFLRYYQAQPAPAGAAGSGDQPLTHEEVKHVV
jgi:ABC-2 type transport system ATP-binding protein